MSSAYATILRKRDGLELSAEEITTFCGEYLRGDVPDYQMAAFLMAVFFRGLSDAELAALVRAGLASGARADLAGRPGIKVDKHSTGGVGDKVSLALAPLVASLGVPVPMMSGRGLGHSGGTVDKLESIPGMRVDLTLDELAAQLQRVGCALITQTESIAPLDRRLYALRDVTATVESVPLIAFSIMTKKLAAGVDALVLDVKVGNGAFMRDRASAERLARAMIAIGAAHGCRTVAYLTAMDRPLGHAIGNALEVEEAIMLLRGEGPADLRELTLVLAAEMLLLGGAADDAAHARARAERAVADGRALEKLREVIEAQGGNGAVVDDPGLLPQAPTQLTVAAETDGVVVDLDTRAIGLAAVALGAGRARLTDRIDPAVGLHLTARPGDRLAAQQPFATVYAADDAAARRAAAALRSAVRIEAGGRADPLPLVLARMT